MDTASSQSDGIADEGEDNETPERRLPCTLPRMKSDPGITRSAAIMLLGPVLTSLLLLALW